MPSWFIQPHFPDHLPRQTAAGASWTMNETLTCHLMNWLHPGILRITERYSSCYTTNVFPEWNGVLQSSHDSWQGRVRVYPMSAYMLFQNETGYCEVRMTADREGYACILYPHARVSCGGYKEAINVHLAIFPQVGDRRTRGNSLRHGPVMSACPFLSWWHRRGPDFREQSDESGHTMGRMDTRTCPLQQALYILMGFTLLWNTTYGLIRMNDPLHSTVKGKLYCKRSCD